MAENVRFGIIGAGMIAQYHAKAIAAAAGAELVAVLSPGRERLDAFAAKHEIRGYTEMADFLADPLLDAVAIASPTGLHMEAAVAAANAGKHVLCEKPLETTPERSQKIIDAARANNVVLAPVFQYRYTPAARLVKKALAAGRFGKILSGAARIKWYRPQSYYDSGAWRGTWELDGGGCLMNQSIHAIDLFIHFTGVPVEVFGYTATVAHERIQVEDNAAAVVRFDNGAFGLIESSTAMEPGWPLEVEITGTRGRARVTAEALSHWDFADSDPVDAEARELMTVKATNSGASDPSTINFLGHQRIIEDMVATITAGADGVIDGLEAKRPIELICGVYESMKTGAPVKLG